MMGFHPHGIIPVSGGLISLTGQWKRLFGDLVPCMMIDFMIHLIPVWHCVSVVHQCSTYLKCA